MISYEELSKVFDMDNPLTLEYFELCSKDTDEPKYFERHHILPKSIFPLFRKHKQNLVNLSYQNHYRCHEILPSICLGTDHKRKMLSAWWVICHTKDKMYVSSDNYQELKRQRIDSISGERNSNFGKTLSEEAKLKISVANSGPGNGNYRVKQDPSIVKARADACRGKRRSEEFKKALSDMKKGTVVSDATKDKLRLAFTGENNPNWGKKFSPETLKRMSDASRGRKASAEARAKMSLSRKGRKLSDSTKDKLSKANTGKKRTPEQKEKMKTAWTEDRKQKSTERQTKYIYRRLDDQGTVIKEYLTRSEITTDGFNAHLASHAARNNRLHGGYRWSMISNGKEVLNDSK